ncbi:MAG: PorT family protein [Flavobacteriales bacterium]|nr:PorT family protein [Flavobacteriales bacterium]
MKHTLIALLLCSTIGLNGFSQTEESNDTLKNVRHEEPTIDTTIIKIGKHDILIIGNHDSDEWKEFDSLCSKKGKEEFKIHWAGLDIGVNGYLASNNSLSVPQGYDFLELDYGRSFSFGFNFAEKNISLYKDHITIVTGLGLNFNSYSFKNNTTLLSNADSIWAYTDTLVNLQKNKLKTTVIELPLMLGFSTHKDPKKSFHLAAGIVLGYKLGAKTKQMYKIGKDKYKPKVKGDFSISPFRYSAALRVGYGDFSLFADYALSPLFEKDKGPELYPFSVGITLMDL